MKIVKTEDTPASMQTIMKITKQIAASAHDQVWDSLVSYCHTLRPQWTGDEMLSVMNDCIAQLAARWAHTMYHKIARQDDTGYSPEDILKNVIEGICALSEAEIVWEKPVVPKEDFKRL